MRDEKNAGFAKVIRNIQVLYRVIARRMTLSAVMKQIIEYTRTA